jgi:hypothetical protein
LLKKGEIGRQEENPCPSPWSLKEHLWGHDATRIRDTDR